MLPQKTNSVAVAAITLSIVHNASDTSHARGCVICCIFTKSSFRLHSYFNVFCTSNLFLTQLHTCLNPLLLFKLHLSFYLSFYLFSVLPINSVPLSFNHLLFYSLIIFVPCVPFHHSLCLHVNISCMWFYLCLATSSPPLPLPYLVIFLMFDSTPISIVMTTPYESDSVYNKLQSCISSLVC